MPKKIALILLILLTLLIHHGHASADWIKSPSNPILYGTEGYWDSSNTHSICIIHESSGYNAWYGGSSNSGWHIGHAYSPNGISGWIKEISPIIENGSQDGWEMEADCPYVVKDSNLYKMWYTLIGHNYLSGSDRFRIGYAFSDNANNLNKQAFVLKGTAGSWDSGGPARGSSVIHDQSEYKMWYAAVNDGQMGTTNEKWQIGYATSPDGISWSKYPDPVISPTEIWELNSVSYPNVIYDEGKYKMWYAATSINLPTQIVYAESNDGIFWEKPANRNPVLTTGNPPSFDSTYISSPFVLKEDGVYKMWYDGFDGYSWRIGYAQDDGVYPTEAPSPTPTASIPPTPIPTTTPIPENKQPIVIIPGLGASWNYEAILLNFDAPPENWKMTPGVYSYNNLIKTLENAGYKTGENLFVYNYDWRKPIDEITNEFSNYLSKTFGSLPATPINIIGHSLGGLIGRTYAQKIHTVPISRLITLGSPNMGVSQTYYLWEGGDLHLLSPAQRLLLGLIFTAKQSKYSTTLSLVREQAPVIKDLLPTYNYLVENGIDKQVNSMIIKNEWLDNLNTIYAPPDNLYAISGLISNSTLFKINVTQRNWLDSILNLWVDGKPAGASTNADGDKTVLFNSSEYGTHTYQVPDSDHRAIVEKEDGLKAIASILSINQENITAESLPDDDSMYAFAVASPVSIIIKDINGEIIGESDEGGKLSVVSGIQPTLANIELIGLGSGKYKLYAGQITAKGDKWETIAGSIVAGQTISLRAMLNPDILQNNLIEDYVGEISKNSALIKIENLKNSLDPLSTPKHLYLSIVNNLNKISAYLNENKPEKAIVELYNLRSDLHSWARQGKITNGAWVSFSSDIIGIIKDIERYYVIINGGIYPQGPLSAEIASAEKLFTRMEDKLKLLTANEKISDTDGALYNLAKEKLANAQSESSYAAHINAIGCQLLSQEIIKFSK